jgi:hypothetical protein
LENLKVECEHLEEYTLLSFLEVAPEMTVYRETGFPFIVGPPNHISILTISLNSNSYIDMSFEIISNDTIIDTIKLHALVMDNKLTIFEYSGTDLDS